MHVLLYVLFLFYHVYITKQDRLLATSEIFIKLQ